MGGIVFKNLNTVAIKSRNRKIRREANNRKEIVLMGLGPCREHLHPACGVWVGCPPPPVALTGTGRDREGPQRLNILVTFGPAETRDRRHH